MSEAVATAALPPGFRPDTDTAGMPAAGVALGVALVVGAAWLAWLARRRAATTVGAKGAARSPWPAFAWPPTARAGVRELQLIESAPLPAGARLQVVGWAGRRYLLATSAQGVPLLIDRDPAEPVEARHATVASGPDATGP